MSSINHTLTFIQPANEVWAYLTDPDLMAIWLMKNDFRPEVGHQFRFITPPMPHIGFDGIKLFTKSLVTYLLMVLFIVLWTLLLIVPGIIAALSYSMSFYILADNPLLTPLEILDESRKMTYGYKWQLFYLFLWFLLLAVLCVLTLGIGFLWLIPYVHITLAKFYDYVKDNPIARPGF